MNLPKRKVNRLQRYDYRSSGYYFITICAAGKVKLFWQPDSADELPVLTKAGKAVDNSIRSISEHYSSVAVDKYVVMPNHIHLILILENSTDGPSISSVVGNLKRAVSLELGTSVWQKGFHDHVIRNEASYQKIWQYIDTNPARWLDDCFYVE